jgi:hypothetical protein
MLSHSPPLPLVIEHDYKESDIASEDEEGLILALKQRNRIRRICLRMAFLKLQKFIMTINEEFPILEYLFIVSPILGKALMLPETLQAPRLHQLKLFGVVPPIRSRLLMTATRLATLSFHVPPIYLPPPKRSASMPFIYTARGARDRLFIPFYSPWGGPATHAHHANHDSPNIP